jgi:quercetin dioxygenase-like cupin family protein
MATQYVRKSEQSEAETVHHEWGSLCWLAGERLRNATGVTVGRVVIRKGASNPRHCHPTCEEVLHLLRGRLRHSVGDDTFVLEPGDTITLPAGVYHDAVSIGDEDAEMFVAYSSARRDFELEGA